MLVGSVRERADEIGGAVATTKQNELLTCEMPNIAATDAKVIFMVKTNNSTAGR